MLLVQHEAHPCAQAIPIELVAFLAHLVAGPWVVDHNVLASGVVFIRGGPL